jgi:hypothetical protein
MFSAAVAVTLSVRRGGRHPALLAFGLIALVFAYTTIANIVERPDGVKIAAFFIAAILVTSLISRIIIANEPHPRDLLEYIEKAYEERKRNQIPPDDRCCS